MRRAAIILLTALSLRAAAGASEWKMAPARLATRWAAEVNPDSPRPEYPRPQMVRAAWTNLNGLWDYAITPLNAASVPSFNARILVPFPIESALSGVETNLDEHSELWYRREFSIPADWQQQRILLHFGAVDFAARVMVDDRLAGFHAGGYDPFTFDITDLLGPQQTHELIVRVIDPTEGDQPRGKQSLKPEGIFYTACSGIWQTVWLEPVPTTAIAGLNLTPDLDQSSLRVEARISGEPLTNTSIYVAAFAGDRLVAQTNASPNCSLALSIPNPRPWSPDDPFLYDLRVALKQGDRIIDQVQSYFGMRKISLLRTAGQSPRIALNGRPILQIVALDQGFWPDGIYTAPTEDAMMSDLLFLKHAGFNLVRKHVKVEPDRWYAACDRLGLLVWQDMPSGNNNTPQSRTEFEEELGQMIAALRNHPCIVQWVLFNEGWGQYDTERLTRRVQALDPSRLVDNASGWTDKQVGDVLDAHTYPEPEAPLPEASRASVIGEFGGLGLVVPGHDWSSNAWSYQMWPDATALQAWYAHVLARVWQEHESNSLSAAIYTQTTDVETECNGLLTYDRAVEKLPAAWLAQANSGQLARRQFCALVPDAFESAPLWRYIETAPPDGWNETNFDDSAWKEGAAGFGAGAVAHSVLRTPWNTADIWLRRNFVLTESSLRDPKLRVHHDDDVDIYLNGRRALATKAWLNDYAIFDIAPEALAALHAGTNTLAVHCHQVDGGQYIDVGIVSPLN